MRRGCGALLSLLALLLTGPAPGADAEPSPSQSRVTDLRVEDGGGWHAENRFWLNWELDTPAGAPPVVAVHFLVRSASHPQAVPEQRIPWRAPYAGPFSLPASGEYLAEVWGEDAAGLRTPPAAALVRLDEGRPGMAEPLLPPGWIGAGAVHLRLRHPAAPLPLSGIRGYAISVDGDPAGSPCASRERCGDAEVDLREGIAGDSLLLPGLSEGSVYVHAVAVSGSGMRSELVGTAVAHVDTTAPRVTLQGVPPGWVNGPVRLLARAGDVLSGMEPAGSAGPFTAIAVDGAPPALGRGDSASAIVSGDGAHRVEYYARDAAGNVNDGGHGGDPPAIATVRIDSAPPRVAFVDRRDPDDPERLEATVADTLSGASPERGAIAVRPARSRQPFEPLPTTRSGGRLLARWDSDSYPRGSYEFQVTGYDAAGNAAISNRRANGSAMVLANPVKTRVSLEAGFGGRQLSWHRCVRVGERRRCHAETIRSYRARPAARTVPFGGGVQLGGRLLAVGGAPLAGEKVEVTETFAAGASPERRTSAVRTAADGTFLARLAPGPSRRVDISFAGTRTLCRDAATPLRLDVRAGVLLRTSTATARIGGAPVVFSGRVLAEGAPATGIPVALQFRLPGLAWSEFRTVKANRKGRFRYPYAFTDNDSRGVRFQFRAAVATEASWPYEPGTSRPVFVTGR